ncbi:WD40 repeat domain-containing serine/threonine protein kinase, partial [Streptomyces sp. NPDC058953]
MGRVWRGHDQTLHRRVAVKEVVLPAGIPPEEREQLLRRTMREARLAGKLSHPGIITVHDVVKDGDTPWIVMEFIPGQSLGNLITENGRLPWERVAAIGLEIAEALAHAHAVGIVHRDLKPDNILIHGSRTVLTDFGIARALDDSAGTRLTRTGTVIGTPQYMPPEQLRGADVTTAGDLWSLGATLYTAVEGRAPFDAATLASLFHAILYQPVPAPRYAGHLTSVLDGLLAKNPDQRPTARTLVSLLNTLHHVRTRPRYQPAVRPGGMPRRPEWPRSDAGTTGRNGSGRRTLVLALIATAVMGIAAAMRAAFEPDEDGPSHRADTAGLADYTAEVYSVVFSPDGKTLASGSRDYTLDLWNAADASLVATILARSVVHAVAFSPDGKNIATGDWDNRVRLWRVADRRLVTTITRHTNSVYAVAFSPDGGTLASAGLDRTVRLWSVPGGAPVATFGGHTDNVGSVAFSPDGKTLASGGWDGTVRLWDVAGESPLATLTGHTDRVLSVAFSPDGQSIASGGQDGRVRLWDMASRTTTTTFGGHTGSVTGVAYTPDGKKIAGAGVDGTVRIWDIAGRSETIVLPGNAGALHSVAISPDGKTVASAGTEGVDLESLR